MSNAVASFESRYPNCRVCVCDRCRGRRSIDDDDDGILSKRDVGIGGRRRRDEDDAGNDDWYVKGWRRAAIVVVVMRRTGFRGNATILRYVWAQFSLFKAQPCLAVVALLPHHRTTSSRRRRRQCWIVHSR